MVAVEWCAACKAMLISAVRPAWWKWLEPASMITGRPVCSAAATTACTISRL
jgi:hypothetical protein